MLQELGESYFEHLRPKSLITYAKWTTPKKDIHHQIWTTKIENLNNFLSTKVIKFLTENHPTKKTPGLDGFTGEFHITKKEMPIPIVHTHSWDPLATGYIRPDFKTRQETPHGKRNIHQ